MKKATSLLTAVLLGAALLTAGTAPAQAASPSVKIKKIPTKTAPYKKSVVIKPLSSHKGNIKYVSRTLTAKRGARTIGKNKTSLRLRAGKYKVSTRVKYRTFVNVTKTRSKRVRAFDAGDYVDARCTITKLYEPRNTTYSDFDSTCSGKFNGTFRATGWISNDNPGNGTWWVNDYEATIQLPVRSPASAALSKSYSTYTPTDRALYRTKTVKTRVRKYSKVRTRTLGQRLVVRAGKRPSRAQPRGWNCPSWAPIKGNAESGIYHVEGGAFYNRTIPEACFSSEAAARNDGYRKSMR